MPQITIATNVTDPAIWARTALSITDAFDTIGVTDDHVSTRFEHLPLAACFSGRDNHSIAGRSVAFATVWMGEHRAPWERTVVAQSVVRGLASDVDPDQVLVFFENRAASGVYIAGQVLMAAAEERGRSQLHDRSAYIAVVRNAIESMYGVMEPPLRLDESISEVLDMNFDSLAVTEVMVIVQDDLGVDFSNVLGATFARRIRETMLEGWTVAGLAELVEAAVADRLERDGE